MGHIMPTFKNTLIGIGPIYDADCTFTFSKQDVTVFALDNTPILIGWIETSDDKLWRFSILSDVSQLPLTQPYIENALISAYSSYDLPSVKALVHYLHAATGFPVKSTWIKAIKAGNFAT